MKVLAISALNHDASVAVIHDEEILFASHTERYSGIKNDPYLNQDILDDAYQYGKPDVIAFYERPLLKKTRQFYAGQYDEVFQTQNIFSNYFKQFDYPFSKTKIKYFDHHKCHAASGYFTSPFNEAAIVCIDAIGEWKTLSIWEGSDNKLKLKFHKNYPHSLGLFYSAFTKKIGLKPNEDEYIMMGMAGWGTPRYKKEYQDRYLKENLMTFKKNFHQGVSGDVGESQYDIAASVQAVTEEIIEDIMLFARFNTGMKNLVYCGGVALNCLANRLLPNHFENIWIMPNPGDSGTVFGCGALINGRLNWKGPYLGKEIKGKYPVNSVLNELLKGNIVGVANGRAEFGPRAFGNRSIIADPRGKHIKDAVNEIKKRQKFRPFSPTILEEWAPHYFKMIVPKSPYMQYVMKCKYPDIYPAIVHVDGTSRVQTVNKKDNPGFYQLLKEFHKETGCPMLLNTSLNVKGMPLVNDIIDVDKFIQEHNIKVYTND